MADSKITALTALTAADPANDMMPIVDVSDTSMAASGTTKRISINNILACSPTATLASATITGDLTVDTSTLKVDSTNNRVGIVNASPTVPLDVVGTIRSKNVAGDVGGLRMWSDSSGDGNIYEYFNGSLKFGVNDTLAMTLNSTGLAVANGNVILSTSGKGIDFSATANSSGTMTSELLNDYEEGTWTATLTGTVANPTIPVTTTGRYTKIGRVVSISAFFSSVITTGASGRIQITGLPFTNNSSIASVGTAAFNSMATFTGSPFASLAASDTTVIMFSSNSAASYAAVNFNAGITQDLWVSLNYTVA
jgi:hypothetical protein